MDPAKISENVDLDFVVRKTRFTNYEVEVTIFRNFCRPHKNCAKMSKIVPKCQKSVPKLSKMYPKCQKMCQNVKNCAKIVNSGLWPQILGARLINYDQIIKGAAKEESTTGAPGKEVQKISKKLKRLQYNTKLVNKEQKFNLANREVGGLGKHMRRRKYC
jgi:hypothetical protein